MCTHTRPCGRICLIALRRQDWWLSFLFYVLRVVLQKKAQTQHAREFQTKSIKEKAVHLSGLFSEDSSAMKVTISSLDLWPHLVALCFAPAVVPPAHHSSQSQLVCLHVEALDVLDDTNMHAACFAQHWFFLTTYYGVTTATFWIWGLSLGPSHSLQLQLYYHYLFTLQVFISVFSTATGGSSFCVFFLCQHQTAGRHSSRLYEQRNRSIARKIRYSLQIGIKLFLNKLFIYFILLFKICN